MNRVRKKEQAEKRGADAQHDQVRTRPAAVGEYPHRKQRARAAPLDQHERYEKHHGRGQRRQHLRVTPMRYPVGPGGGLGQAVDQQRDAAGAGDRAGHVDPARPAGRFGQHARRRGRHQDPDRDVDEQHPPP
jgi:hypothetical protein